MCNRLRSVMTIIGPILAMLSEPAGAEAPIQVLVYGEHQRGNLVYHYTVINNGTEEFNNFTIGSEYDPDDQQTWPELGRLPVGWHYGKEGETGTEILLDPMSTTQPTGWVPVVYGKQGTAFFYLRWESDTQGIDPGQTLSGFSVTVPKGKDSNLVPMPAGSELKYLNGHFRVGLWAGLGSNRQHQKIHGTIEKLDTTPPTLSVSASPQTLWPPNGKFIPITATITVMDDYDPQPEIKIESITANESLTSSDIVETTFGADDRQFKLVAKRDGETKTGRIYTITYSATDASDNKAMASTTVTVPHDQRQK